jgi:hypothetical protein
MKSVIALVLAVSLVAGSTIGCAGNKPPILKPEVAAALTNGLGALVSILSRQNVNPLILSAISDAQTGIAADVSGATWGQIVRGLLTQLYSQLPADVLANPMVWAAFAAIEIALATVGA